MAGGLPSGHTGSAECAGGLPVRLPGSTVGGSVQLYMVSG